MTPSLVSRSCELRFQLNQINATKETHTALKTDPEDINSHEQSANNTKSDFKKKDRSINKRPPSIHDLTSFRDIFSNDLNLTTTKA